MIRSIIVSCIVLMAFCGANPAFAQFERTAMLIDTPSALVLEKGKLCIAGTVTGPISGKAVIDWWEGNFGLRYGLFDRLEVDVTAFHFDTWVLGFNYQLKKPASRDKWSLSAGAHDISWHKHVSALGHGEKYAETVWSDDDFRPKNGAQGEIIKPFENFSAFVVATVPITQFVRRLPPVLRGTRYNFGIGRGRYVGYDGPNENLNSDIFSDEYHPDTAIGLFGGLEVSLGSRESISLRDLSLAIEYDSRDLNAAVKTEIGPITAAVVLHKIEGFGAKGRDLVAGKEDKFQRLGLGLSYTMDFPKRHPAPAAATQPIPRPPAPVVTPPTPPPAAPVEPAPVAPPVVAPPVLKPIYFDLDRSDVRPDQRTTMRANADILEAYPDWKVLVEGHCDERATNEYNMALGQRRAESAKRYLVNLGISPARLTTISFGEERPADPGHDESAWWKNRRAEFTLVR